MTTEKQATTPAPPGIPGFEDSLDYVTVMIGEQIFGLPIHGVHDVFIANRITPVPRAPAEIMGLINLRGRVVTAICLRRRLGQPPAIAMPLREKSDVELVSVGIDHGGEAFALIVDAVGEVMHLDQSTLEPVPVHLDRRWSALAAGVHRLDGRLLVVLDIESVLKLDLPTAA